VTDQPYGVEYDPEWRKRAGVNNSNRMGKVRNDDRADWREAWALFPGDVAYIWHGALHSRQPHKSEPARPSPVATQGGSVAVVENTAPVAGRRDIDNEMRFWIQQQQEDAGWRQLPRLVPTPTPPA